MVMTEGALLMPGGACARVDHHWLVAHEDLAPLVVRKLHNEPRRPLATHHRGSCSTERDRGGGNRWLYTEYSAS